MWNYTFYLTTFNNIKTGQLKVVNIKSSQLHKSRETSKYI